MSTITDVAQLLTTIALIPSLIFVGVQTRQLVEQARAGDRSSAHNASHNAVTLMSQVDFYLAAHPDLIGYFYYDEPLPKSEVDRRRILVLAGIWADAIEYGLMATDLEKLVQPYAGWQSYATKTLSSSPALRQRLNDDPDVWPRLIKYAQQIGRL